MERAYVPLIPSRDGIGLVCFIAAVIVGYFMWKRFVIVQQWGNMKQIFIEEFKSLESAQYNYLGDNCTINIFYASFYGTFYLR